MRTGNGTADQLKEVYKEISIRKGVCLDAVNKTIELGTLAYLRFRNKFRVIRIGFAGLTIEGFPKYSIIGGGWPQTVAEDLHEALISCTRPRRFSLQPFFFCITGLFSFSFICGESQGLSGSIRQMTEKLPCSPLMEAKILLKTPC